MREHHRSADSHGAGTSRSTRIADTTGLTGFDRPLEIQVASSVTMQHGRRSKRLAATTKANEIIVADAMHDIDAKLRDLLDSSASLA